MIIIKFVFHFIAFGYVGEGFIISLYIGGGFIIISNFLVVQPKDQPAIIDRYNVSAASPDSILMHVIYQNNRPSSMARPEHSNKTSQIRHPWI
jgi:hypothetical protein